MNLLRAACLLLLLSGTAFAAPLKNVLAGHASPYLAQHGADPVAWQEWNAETVARARREGKLLFVSVGYFACHWCHVMQRESYRDPAIARLLNTHFIPVKVDRELNGALDAALIDFVERLKGVSGWPLNAFVTPEGYPAYALMYAPPIEFRGLIERLQTTWQSRRTEFEAAAREAAGFDTPPPAAPALTADEARRAYLQAALQEADTLQGGFGDVSKFPLPTHLRALLEIQARVPEPRLRDFLLLTLDQMAGQGLRDAVQGGFFRYTIDPDWQTPHFEKMLYDNAQLAVVYARAAEVLQRPAYRTIAHETLDWMLAALRLPDGSFATATSALDARGREGGDSLWTVAMLRRVLSTAEFEAARKAWKLDSVAPFEHGFLPRPGLGLSPALFARLKAARPARPPRDDKRNAGLNGLALSALSRAGGDVPRFAAAARALHDFLTTRMSDGDALLRTRAGPRVFKAAELDDYAYVATGLEDYGQRYQVPAARQQAQRLAAMAWTRFFGPAGWRQETRPLLASVRPQASMADGALPSPAWKLLQLAVKSEKMAAQAVNASRLAASAVRHAPFDHPGAVLAGLK